MQKEKRGREVSYESHRTKRYWRRKDQTEIIDRPPNIVNPGASDRTGGTTTIV